MKVLLLWARAYPSLSQEKFYYPTARFDYWARLFASSEDSRGWGFTQPLESYEERDRERI